jgi:hypothetical protein
MGMLAPALRPTHQAELSHPHILQTLQDLLPTSQQHSNGIVKDIAISGKAFTFVKLRPYLL